MHSCKKLHEGLWRFQDGGSFQLNPLATTGRLRILSRIGTIEIRRYKQIALEYSCFESFPFRENFLFSSAKSCDFDGMLGIGLSVSMYTTKIIIGKRRFNVPRLKECFTFSVKDRYQLNYIICIKDFNAQTITSLKLNITSPFM